MKKVKCVSAQFYEDLTKGNIYDVLKTMDLNTMDEMYFLIDDINEATWYSSEFFEDLPKDNVVDSVVEQFKKRSNVGVEKYGVTMDREDLSPLQWLQHLQEELMDATLYVEKLKQNYE